MKKEEKIENKEICNICGSEIIEIGTGWASVKKVCLNADCPTKNPIRIVCNIKIKGGECDE